MNEFTDHDEAMMVVMADLERVRDHLYSKVGWFIETWCEVSDDDCPYFGLSEDLNDDGTTSVKLVFVLRDEVPIQLLEYFRS